MNKLRLDLAWFNNFLNFSNDKFSGSCHVCIEVSGSFVEVQVSKSVCLLGLDEGVVAKDCLLFDVFFAIENFDIFRWRINFNISFSILKLSGVFYWESAFLNLGSDSSGSVKGWDAGAA